MTLEALPLQHTPIITFGYIMQLFISLLIVMALIYITARFVLPKLKTTSTGNIIKILDRVYLEPQVSAYVLKAGKDSWLIVTSSKQIARIDKIEVES